MFETSNAKEKLIFYENAEQQITVYHRETTI